MKAEQIKRMRKASGFRSAEAFAHAIDMQPTTIKRWESGELQPSRSGRVILRLFEKHGPDIFYALKPQSSEAKKLPKIFTHLAEEGCFK